MKIYNKTLCIIARLIIMKMYCVPPCVSIQCTVQFMYSNYLEHSLNAISILNCAFDCSYLFTHGVHSLLFGNQTLPTNRLRIQARLFPAAIFEL